MKQIQETPESIVQDGQVLFGTFREPLRNLNFRDAEIPGGSLLKPFRKTRLKEWIGYGIRHPEWFITIFFLDAKLVTSALFYASNHRTGKVIRCARTLPGRIFPLPDNLWPGKYDFRLPRFRMEFDIDLERGTHVIKVDIKDGPLGPRVEGELVFHENLKKTQPLVSSFPLVGGNSAYTHKGVFPAEGRVIVGDEEIVLDASRDISILDEHRSFLPYSCTWRWATFAGRDADGNIIGLNIGDHDTVEDQERWGENCVWAGDKMSLIGPAEFDFSSSNRMNPWRIRERAGRAEVTFRPESVKEENTGGGPLRMRYFQLCGRFEGFLIDDSGEKHEVKDFYGVAEKMDMKS